MRDDRDGGPCSGARALPGRRRLSGLGQGRDGFTAIQLQPPSGLCEAFGITAAGEDHREREMVEAVPVRRAVAGAGQAGILAEDAVSLAMVQILHPPVTAVQPQQGLR